MHCERRMLEGGFDKRDCFLCNLFIKDGAWIPVHILVIKKGCAGELLKLSKLLWRDVGLRGYVFRVSSARTILAGGKTKRGTSVHYRNSSFLGFDKSKVHDEVVQDRRALSQFYFPCFQLA
jgi:hypothetical protein